MLYRGGKLSEKTEFSSTSSALESTCNSNDTTTRTTQCSPSIIGAGLEITGNVVSSGDVRIDGLIEGDVDSRLLTIGQSGKVQGSITGEAVRIAGKVEGRIRARFVTLHKTADVIGDILHEHLTVEAGGQIEGRISCTRGNADSANYDDKVASISSNSDVKNVLSSSSNVAQERA